MILVYTGDGKGKTSAALGAAFRALGHGWRVLVVQFLKGDWPIVFGELQSAKRHARLEFLQAGRGFVNIMGDKKPLKEHRRAASAALLLAKKKILSSRYDLVALDEALCALETAGASLLAPKELFGLLKAKPVKTHIILTGRLRNRSARKKLLAVADLYTEMKEVKHPYQKGIPALKGIDY